MPCVAALLTLLAACGGGQTGSEAKVPVAGAASVSARSVPLPAGDADCPHGGVLVETGIDENGNGVLDQDEVDRAEKVCNGTPGEDALVTLVKLPVGDGNCPAGGLRIDSGLDEDGDGQLGADEIDASGYLCNGRDGDPGAPGPQGPQGPQGPAGADGRDFLIALGDEPPGANCSDGGTRIDGGLDEDGDGLLGADEITQTRFVCTPRGEALGWQGATLVENGFGMNSAYVPRLAARSAALGAIAVWLRSDGTRIAVYANHHDPEFGWGAPERLVPASMTGNAKRPHVAMDGAGNALAVWIQDDNDVVVARYRSYAGGCIDSCGWRSPQVIDETNGSVSEVAVVMNAQGEAIVFWVQQDLGGQKSLYARHFSPTDGTWGAIVPLEATAGDVQAFAAAMNEAGDAVVAWTQHDGSRYNLLARYYPAGGAWQTPEWLANDGAFWSVDDVDVAVDPQGHAMVVWAQSDALFAAPAKESVYAKRYDGVKAAWEVARHTLFKNARRAPSGAQVGVAFDGAGNALVVWTQPEDERLSLYGKRYLATGDWTAKTVLERHIGQVYDPLLAVTEDGVGFVVWQQSDGMNDSLWANRFVPGMGWGRAELLEINTAGPVREAALAVDDGGNALVVWSQTGLLDRSVSRDYIWSNRWIAP